MLGHYTTAVLRNPFSFILLSGIFTLLPISVVDKYGAFSNTEPTGTIPEEGVPAVFESGSRLGPSCDSVKASEIDFTLVSQLSIDRLHIMKEQCRRWGDHPISIAVSSHVSHPVIKKVLPTLGCKNVEVAVLDVNQRDSYPVNKLRNAALANVKTTHAVYIDADFLVSTNLYESLLKHREQLVDSKIAVVVPALQLVSICPDCHNLHLEMVPQTKEEARDLFGNITQKTSVIRQFDYKNPEGHASTDTEEWFLQPPDSLTRIPCIRSERYEPYLTVRYCKDLPPFQEAFVGYGQNKITWIRHILRSGYQLHRLGGGFATHFPHKKSKDYMWRKKAIAKYGRDSLLVGQLSSQFTEWMSLNVKNETVMPKCRNADD